MLCCLPAPAADEAQLDASPALFTVMAAINAAGYDADLDSPANSPVRAMVRADLAAKKLPVIDELKRFFAAHRQRDWSNELSQYVSFALSVDGPPSFAYRYKPDELPPDVIPLNGFEQLLARFYQEADLEALWRKAQPAFEQTIARYHQPAMAALMGVNAYLRNSTRAGPLGSRFQIYIDLLGAPNQIHTRSYKDDYFVVLTPSPEPQADDIRHAFLHYLVDPMTAKYSTEVEKKKSLSDFAQGAPALADSFKADFILLAAESLIKAIEARLAPPARRQGMVDEAVREGFILTAAFAEALPAYEKDEQALRFYFPDLVKAIDLRRETERLDKVQFASEPRVRKARPAPAPPKPEVSGAQKTLDSAEQLYRGKEFDKAREAYLEVLKQSDEKPVHAQAWFGLARIAALQNDPETAVRLFQKALESSPDGHVAGWSHVYLGRLSDAAGDRDEATRHYRAALAVKDASEDARKAAQSGLSQAFRKESRQP